MNAPFELMHVPHGSWPLNVGRSIVSRQCERCASRGLHAGLTAR